MSRIGGALLSGWAAAIALPSDQLAPLMEAVASLEVRMKDKVAKFQAELQQVQEDTAAKALKRASYKWSFTFKWNSNEA